MHSPNLLTATGVAVLLFLTPQKAAATKLVLECHQLLQGTPDPDGNQFVLDGDILTNHIIGQTIVLSSSKLMLLTPYAGGNSSWAIHRIDGHKVHRTVFWKNRAGKTLRVLKEVFDFDAHTVRDEPRGPDSCHNNGK